MDSALGFSIYPSYHPSHINLSYWKQFEVIRFNFYFYSSSFLSRSMLFNSNSARTTLDFDDSLFTQIIVESFSLFTRRYPRGRTIYKSRYTNVARIAFYLRIPACHIIVLPVAACIQNLFHLQRQTFIIPGSSSLPATSRTSITWPYPVHERTAFLVWIERPARRIDRLLATLAGNTAAFLCVYTRSKRARGPC